jgi:branched-chain amino acid transport system substrate-binding protein
MADDVIKVGYLAALTGDWAAYGQTELNAAKLAVSEINAKGGVLASRSSSSPMTSGPF